MHKQQKLDNGIRGNCDFHNRYKQLQHCKLKINMTFFCVNKECYWNLHLLFA